MKRIITIMALLALVSGCVEEQEIVLLADTTVTLPETTTTTIQPIQTERGAGWERNCRIENDRKVCNMALYSSTHFVFEDDTWKPIKEAKSLKDVWNKVYLEKDPDFDIDIIQLNYTDYELNLSFNASNWEQYPECASSKENDIKCNFKLTKKQEWIDEEGNKQKYEEKFQYKYQMKNGILKEDLKFKSKGNPLNSTYTFGGNSTTIILQDANTENLDDTSITSGATNNNYGTSFAIELSSGTYTKNGLIKLNISAVPNGATINEAYLVLVSYYETIDTGESIYVDTHHIYDSWAWEETNVTWNTRPTDSDYNTTYSDRVQMNNTDIDKPLNWTITDIVIASQLKDECSIYLKSSVASGSPGMYDYFYIGSKESGEIKPLVEIVYTEVAGDTTDPTIYPLQPANNTVNATATPGFVFRVIDDIAATTNCDLYINGTEYGNNAAVANNTETELIANDSLSNGDYLWNITCFDGTNFNSSVMYNISILTCTTPVDDLDISVDTTLCSGTYELNDVGGDGLIKITGSNLNLTCDGTHLIGDGTTSKGIIITGNNVTVENCEVSQYEYGIFSDGYNNISLLGNSLHNNTWSGIRADNGGGLLINNTYTWNNSVYGLVCYVKMHNSIIENFNASDTPYGIYLQNNLENIIIRNVTTSNLRGVGTYKGDAVYVACLADDYCTNITVDTLNARNTSYCGILYHYHEGSTIQNINITLAGTEATLGAIRLNNCTDVLIRDANLSQAWAGFELIFNSTNHTLINVSYDNESICNGCNYSRKWWADVTIKDSAESPLSGATVSVNDSLDFLFSDLSDANGIIPRLNLTQYIRSYTTQIGTLNTITVTLTGYEKNETYYNFTTNQNISIFMVAAVPAADIYWDWWTEEFGWW